MRTKRIQFTTAFVFAVSLCFSTAHAWLWLIPQEQLGDPLASISGDWGSDVFSKDVRTLNFQPNLPILGYYVNSARHYYYRGNTQELNRFLSRCDPAIKAVAKDS